MKNTPWNHMGDKENNYMVIIGNSRGNGPTYYTLAYSHLVSMYGHAHDIMVLSYYYYYY